MSDKVVILIIAHKPTLQWYEAIGLEQCFRVPPSQGPGWTVR